MKKIPVFLSAIVIALIAAFFLFGCGGGGDNGGDNGGKNEPATFTGITFVDKTVTYDGNEHVLEISGTCPEGTQVTYTNNKGTNAGTYNASVTLEKENYETLTLNAKLTIGKATFTGITFVDKTVTYDGNEHVLEISGTCPEGTQVTYTDNKGTNAGTYNASVKLENANYEDLTLTAKLTVEKATFTGITFTDKTFVWTGTEKEITVQGELPEGTTVTYTDNKATAAGVYNAKAVITNPNYHTLELEATLTINSLQDVASGIIDSLLDKPDPWSFLPQAFSHERMAYDTMPVTDFTAFVNVSDIGDKIIGKQMNVLYEGLTSATTILGYVDTVYAVGATITEVYQTYINNNPDNYSHFEGSAAGFKLSITVDGEKYAILAGNSVVAIELTYDNQSKERTGRIQLTDGAAIKYEAGDGRLKLAIKVTIAEVGNLKQIEFVRSSGAMTGYFYEYTGTESKNLKTSAVISSNYTGRTYVMSNKRESDDMLINGYEEVYDSLTGKYIGGEVRENIKLADYDTLWFMLADVAGINSVKAIHETNGINADTIYINGIDTAIKTKLVGGISLKATSRRFDIEMKDVWYVVATTEGGKTTYKTEKTSIPMLFVQEEQTDAFGADMKSANSAQFTAAPALPSLTPVKELYESLQQLFLTIKEEVTFTEIISYIGDKNSFFDNQTV